MQVTPTEGPKAGTKMFMKLPDPEKGEIKFKDGSITKGFKAVATKDQKVALGGMPFCPYHAHALHAPGEVCTKWIKMITNRQKGRAAEIERRETKAENRKAKYLSAQVKGPRAAW